MRELSSDGNAETVSEWLALEIQSLGIDKVFTLSGGMIVFLLDQIHQKTSIEIVPMRDERSAGFAAEGYSRQRLDYGVAFATSGPGATNLITSIASAYFDSSPVIFITGQVSTKEKRKRKNQRQNGFQELDIVSAVKDITKYSAYAKNAKSIPKIWNEAISSSKKGRPGPVLIDIPIDVQQQKIPLNILNRYNTKKNEKTKTNLLMELYIKFRKIMLQIKLRNLQQMIYKSNAPLFLVGGGVRISNSVEDFNNLINRSEIPVVTSLQGLDAIGDDSPKKIGFIGSYGNRWANLVLKQSDLILVLGSRLDVRQTGEDIERFTKSKNIVRVDIDSEELRGRIKANTVIKSDLSDFLGSVKQLDVNESAKSNLRKVISLKKEFKNHLEQPSLTLNPNRIIKVVTKYLGDVMSYVVDVGQHQMWAAQSIEINNGQRFITSGGLGSMGFAVPAAIGASLALNCKCPIAVFTGDGCFQMSISELQTIVERNLNIHIFLFNNNQHGMVAQFQSRNTQNRYIATREGYMTPNFAKVVQSFEIPHVTCKSIEEIPSIIQHLKSINGPSVVEFMIPQEAMALPRLNESD